MKAFLAIAMMSALIAGPVAAQTAPTIPVPPAPRVMTPAAVPAPMPIVPAVAPAGSDSVVYSYRLGAGDKVKVTIFDEPDLSGTFAVSGEGKVSVPLIGDIQAAGLTAPQLQTALETAYQQGYLKDPKVNVEVLSFRPFYILGEVKMPGEYPYDNGMTVVKAVALAQGFTYRADEKRVFIKHLNQTKEEQIPLTSSQEVAPGDTIRIAERYF
jgi:protein involved in polysaccharide export with SLBB domain